MLSILAVLISGITSAQAWPHTVSGPWASFNFGGPSAGNNQQRALQTS